MHQQEAKHQKKNSNAASSLNSEYLKSENSSSYNPSLTSQYSQTPMSAYVQHNKERQSAECKNRKSIVPDHRQSLSSKHSSANLKRSSLSGRFLSKTEPAIHQKIEHPSKMMDERKSQNSQYNRLPHNINTLNAQYGGAQHLNEENITKHKAKKKGAESLASQISAHSTAVDYTVAGTTPTRAMDNVQIPADIQIDMPVRNLNI